MLSKIIGFHSALLSFVLGFAAAHNTVIENVAIPQGWKSFEAVDSEPITLRISLKQENAAELHQLLLAISTPGHDKYRKHLERDALNAFTRPAPGSMEAVLGWLKSGGIANAEVKGGDWVVFSTDVGTANNLFATHFLWFSEDNGESKRLRTLQYSVPEHIARHINLVYPTTDFVSLQNRGSRLREGLSVTPRTATRTGRKGFKKRAANGTIDYSCTNVLAVDCLRKAYNVDYNFTDTTNIGKVAFVAFEEQNTLDTDTRLFQELLFPRALGQRNQRILINGGINNQSSTQNGEANIDSQLLLAMSYPIPIEEFIVGGLGQGLLPEWAQPGVGAGVANMTGLPWVEYMEYLLALPNNELPHTISHSYSETEQIYPVPLAEQICTMMGKLGARGVSFFTSSGDDGAGHYCDKNDGTNAPYYAAKFPPSCPYVTAVGGSIGFSPPISGYHAGAGYSNYFPRPDYQKPIVDDYVKALNDSNAKYYNQSGRAYPDLVAQYIKIYGVNNGEASNFGGTSLSTPLVAGIFGLVNAVLLSHGKPPMGFINPWLYKEGYKAMTDVSVGDSIGGCTYTLNLPGESWIPNAGWAPAVGWDSATGFGMPDFQRILDMVMSY